MSCFGRVGNKYRPRRRTGFSLPAHSPKIDFCISVRFQLLLLPLFSRWGIAALVAVHTAAIAAVMAAALTIALVAAHTATVTAALASTLVITLMSTIVC
jgi:hypothetical protein